MGSSRLSNVGMKFAPIIDHALHLKLTCYNETEGLAHQNSWSVNALGSAFYRADKIDLLTNVTKCGMQTPKLSLDQ